MLSSKCEKSGRPEDKKRVADNKNRLISFEKSNGFLCSIKYNLYFCGNIGKKVI